jgi:DNA mismatch repair ATPase MutS
MSVRAPTPSSICKYITKNRLSAARTYSPSCIDSARRPLLALSNSALLTWPPSRGAKTKSVLKKNDLPQGVLPALPPDPSDNGQTKAIPTVIQQHLNNVHNFPDCVVLTRVGDFYELYDEQVDQYAPLLNLKKAKKGEWAMAGFQYTALERYLKILVQDLGLKVAISEQIRLSEDERTSKGGPLYSRKVTRVVTAGTLVDEAFVDPYDNNFLLAVHIDGSLPSNSSNIRGNEAYERYKRATKVGVSWVDLSSGAFFTQTIDLASLPSLVARVGPREVIADGSLGENGEASVLHLLGDSIFALHFHTVAQPATSISDWSSMLERPVPECDQAAFARAEFAAGSLILDYIHDKLPDTEMRLQPPVRRSEDEYMAIDKQSLRGLEIKSTLRDGVFKGSLLHSIRHTKTTSGARLLSQRLLSPSMNLSVINQRLDLVEELLNHNALREDVTALLKQTFDSLRLLQRFSIGKGDADDLLDLARTINVTAEMADLLHRHITSNQESDEDQLTDLDFLWDVLARLDLDGPSKASKAILTAIDEEGLNRKITLELESREEAEGMAGEVTTADEAGEKVPRLTQRSIKTRTSTPWTAASDTSTEDIWIMRRSASATLERAHSDLGLLLEARQSLTLRLRKQIRAESLNLKWSPQYGHHCHLKGKKDARADLSVVESARVISSKATSKTFYLSDWTHLGTRIDDAKLRIRVEEERVFDRLRKQVIENLMKLRRNAAVLDELDVACSSAIIAKARGLVRPILDDSTSHNIIGGRHPTVDIGLEIQGRQFVTNDCLVGDPQKIYLITGPNMGGKSTYLRQNALITILAQTGCFVPAEYAKIGLVDKIFSRVGSADNLYEDQSTFMVEMVETSQILTQATERSFVIMDEVGRGTTPEASIAVGYACLDHLHRVNKCRTLFATHFHALIDMVAHFNNVAYYCSDIARDGDAWVYMHKLKPGVNRESHALQVVKLACMPAEAIDVATDVLSRFERQKNSQNGSDPVPMAAVG